MRPATTILVIRSVIGALLAALAVANFVTGSSCSACSSPRSR
jgi:hypothetical protein